MSYQSMEEAQERCKREGIEFWKAVQLEDADERDVKETDSWEQMRGMWQAMLDSIDNYDPSLMSRSGLVGKEGGLMEAYREEKDTLCGDYMAKVMANALKMGCNNACMKRIVAAPTAGACGVLPAVLVTYFREYDVPEEVSARLLRTGHIWQVRPADVRRRSARAPVWLQRQSAM